MTGITRKQRPRLCPGCGEVRTIGERCGCGCVIPEPEPPKVMDSCRNCGRAIQAGTKCPFCGQDPEP